MSDSTNISTGNADRESSQISRDQIFKGRARTKGHGADASNDVFHDITGEPKVIAGHGGIDESLGDKLGNSILIPNGLTGDQSLLVNMDDSRGPSTQKKIPKKTKRLEYHSA